MTNREFFATIASNDSLPAEMREKAVSLIEALDKKNARRSSAPTKKQIENAPIKEAILQYICEVGKEVTATELRDALNITTQKAGALCRVMVEDGKLVKGERKEKGKGLVKTYSLCVNEEEEEES